MISTAISVPEGDVKRLLAAANPDCALLYLYLRSGNGFDSAKNDLQMAENRLSLACATLRQMGLWQEEKTTHIAPGERPNYTETDVVTAVDYDKDFKTLYGEIQRMLGKTLTTEELKILLGFQRYLGLPTDVIMVLVTHCRERARQKGSLRNPSLRTIEKEAYAWAEQGIDTMEEAAAYIQSLHIRSTRIENLKKILQVYGRPLSGTEEHYARSWLDMGFEDEVIAMAYDRTCVNTGHLNWSYMNKILQRWHNAGLHTADAVKSGGTSVLPKGANGELGAAELEAIAQLMKEG